MNAVNEVAPVGFFCIRRLALYPSLLGIALIDNNLGDFLKSRALIRKRKYS